MGHVGSSLKACLGSTKNRNIKAGEDFPRRQIKRFSDLEIAMSRFLTAPLPVACFLTGWGEVMGILASIMRATYF